MRVLHVPFVFHPDPVGGTEVYVVDLCEGLTALGVENAVSAPTAEKAGTRYEHGGMTVWRFPVSPNPGSEALYGAGDAAAAEALGGVLEEAQPDLVHFHAFSPAVSVLALRQVRARGLPALFTFHTPTTICMRGTLLRWGSVPCDGEMIPGRCTACMLNGLGVPKLLAGPVAGFSALGLPLPNRMPWRAEPLVRQRMAAVREWLGGMDRIIVFGDWGWEMLLRNGVAEARMRRVLHGVPQASNEDVGQARVRSNVRLVFFGRADVTKGLEVLLEAMSLVPELPLEVVIHGIVQSAADPYAKRVEALATKDSRVTIMPPVARQQVVKTMQKFDAVVVPSICLETGPLVVLEAFSAGVPVVGTRLGGIAEKVRDGVDGLLVNDTSPTTWAATLRRLVRDQELLPKLKAGVRPPRSTREVAEDMRRIYEEVLAKS